MIRRFGAPLVFLLFGSLPIGAELLAGAARVSIVPPFPTHMGGFGDRMDTFTGVHDDLYARALVLDNGETELLIVTTDLMSVDGELVRLARNAIEDATGIAPTNVMITAAHNHSAPSYYQKVRNGEAHPPLEGFLVDQFTKAAVEAHGNKRSALAGYRNGQITGATRNRQQNNETVVDTQVGVLRVEEAEGRGVIAVLFNFTGHPVIVGSRNLELSGEFPGWASRTVESVLGGVALFTQGACGDVTVHRSGDPFMEIQRLGRLIAGEVVKTAESIRPSADADLAAASTVLTLPPKALPPPDELEREMAAAQARLDAIAGDSELGELRRALEGEIRLHRALLAQSKERDGDGPRDYEAEVQVFKIANAAITAIPGEIFVEYGLELRQRTGQVFGLESFLAGYANGYVGYIVTPRAMETGGYEASVARVSLDSGRRMVETAVTLLTDIVLN